MLNEIPEGTKVFLYDDNGRKVAGPVGFSLKGILDHYTINDKVFVLSESGYELATHWGFAKSAPLATLEEIKIGIMFPDLTDSRKSRGTKLVIIVDTEEFNENLSTPGGYDLTDMSKIPPWNVVSKGKSR